MIIPVFYLFLIFVYFGRVFWSSHIASRGLSVAASTADTLYCVAWLLCCRAGTLGMRAQEFPAVGPGVGSGVMAAGPGAGSESWP